MGQVQCLVKRYNPRPGCLRSLPAGGPRRSRTPRQSHSEPNRDSREPADRYSVPNGARCPSRDCRRQKSVPATFDFGSWVPSTSIVVAGGPVDELAQDVHVAGVAGGLFDHVKQHPSH